MPRHATTMVWVVEVANMSCTAWVLVETSTLVCPLSTVYSALTLLPNSPSF